ncbi:hypothetical protein NEF87_002282 [Candidatus Lokiarchaeum ossiferum]|uniref:Transposase n=1 Tax=Candidatus Lokiarchaeum ossiferum TaxID=2951803 RepID=A0ABY6HUH3_9ARCH|nr:hypothetical protein NEF87_002282 [Candidatus Lokiarchaeum sp. B-35]
MTETADLVKEEPRDKVEIRKRLIIIENQIKWLKKIRETLQLQLKQ